MQAPTATTLKCLCSDIETLPSLELKIRLRCQATIPEFDVDKGGLREITQAFNVQDLLNLSPSLYQWLHCFRLNVEL